VRFVLFVEGKTEKGALPSFFKRWLDPRLKQPVGVIPVRFEGWPQYQSDIQRKVALHLSAKSNGEIIAAIGLLDLYGPTFYPPDKKSVQQRYQWAKSYFEERVGDKRFSQHFAVHETEAWLLANPSGLPNVVGKALPGRCTQPETVNFDEHPSKLLSHLYRDKLGKRYQKVVDGYDLFQKMDPSIAYEKCPYLKALLDYMLDRAKDKGLGK
jgi:hypothetical protein